MTFSAHTKKSPGNASKIKNKNHEFRDGENGRSKSRSYRQKVAYKVNLKVSNLIAHSAFCLVVAVDLRLMVSKFL